MKRVLSVLVLMLLVVGSAWAGEHLNLVPADASMVLHIDVKKAMAAPVLAKRLTAPKGQGDALMQAAGFDPDKNLTDVVIFVLGKTAEAWAKPEIGMIFTGEFDLAKITKAVGENRQGQKAFTVGKYEGFTALQAKQGDPKIDIVLLDGKTAVAGTKTALATLLKTRAGMAPAALADAAFCAMLKSVDAKATSWGLVVIPDTMRAEAKANPPSAGVIAGVRGIYFNADVTDQVKLVGGLELENPAQAAGADTAVAGVLAATRTALGEKAPMSQLIGQVKLETSGSTIKGNLNMDAEKMVDLLKQMVKSQTPAPK